MMTKAFARKLFGVKYEKIMRNIVISIVIFGGLYLAGLKIAVAPFVICLMISMLTVGEMWHALVSDDNLSNMKQIYMLPMENKSFVFSYIVSLGSYVFITRTLPLMAAIFAVGTVSVRMIVIALLCVVSATLLAAGMFAWEKLRILAVIWFCGMLAAFWFLNATVWIWVVLCASIAVELVLLMQTDAYAFYREEKAKVRVTRGLTHHSVWLYIFRYITSHKNYLVNTLILWGVGALLPLTFKQLIAENSNMYSIVIPIGFAILSLNTPICILISCDPELEKAINCLPGQKGAFFVPYCLFIFTCNMIADAIYLVSLRFILGELKVMMVIVAVVFAMVSAVFSVLLECYFPIRGWKIENELWNHPRKYIVPGVMILFAGIIGMIL